MENLQKETFGKMIDRLMEESGKKQSDIAGVCACDSRTIYRIRKDEQLPSMEVLEWLIVIFGETVREKFNQRIAAKEKELPEIRKRLGW